MPAIAIVGGGIAGLLGARELLRAGQSVTLIERSAAVGQEASWAAGGLLTPLGPWRYPASILSLVNASLPLYRDLCRELIAGGFGDPELTESGLLVLGGEERRAGLEWSRSTGIRAQVLDEPGLALLEPGLNSATGGLLLPDASQIRNPRLLKALRAQFLALGGDLKEGVKVLALRVSRGHVEGVETDAGFVPARQVLLTAGAWSKALLADTGWSPEIWPVRGQMLLFRPAEHLLEHMVLEDRRYLVPRRDGAILVGSTSEEVGFDKSTTEEARRDLARFARGLLPQLGAQTPVAHWAGLRPGSPGGIPYISPHAQVRGLYLNAGHYRNGLCTAPASARLVADLMLGRAPSLDPSPYAWNAPRSSNMDLAAWRS